MKTVATNVLLCLWTVILIQCGFSDDGGGTCEEGTNTESLGILAMEAEDAPLSSPWERRDLVSGFIGEGYVSWAGNSTGSPGSFPLVYDFVLETPGIYRFQWRSNYEGDSTYADAWVRIVGVSEFFAQKDAGPRVYPEGIGRVPVTPGISQDGWFRVFRRTTSTGWQWATETVESDPHAIFMETPAAGAFSLEISGRTPGFSLDRLVLTLDSQTDSADYSLAPVVIPCD